MQIKGQHKMEDWKIGRDVEIKGNGRKGKGSVGL